MATPYGGKVLERASAEIRALQPGSRNMEIARIAYTVGGFVGGGEIGEDEARLELEAAAREVGKDEGSIMADTARRALLAGAKEPIRPSDRGPGPRYRGANRPQRPRRVWGWG